MPGRLEVHLDVPLPGQVAVGLGTAVFVCGWCFCPDGQLRSLRFVLDGEPQPVMAFGMPRLDPFEELQAPLSYRSGFWGLVRIAPRDVAEWESRLALEAELANGAIARAEVGAIAFSGGARAPAPPAATASAAICMATHDPPPALFARQIESIRGQTHGDWVCLISDDCSRPERFASLRQIVGDDPRFVISRSPTRLGFYRNFERCLAMVPADAQFVALADQDDFWHPDKLETLVRELEPAHHAQLVYSDARVVTSGGELISETYWSDRHNNHGDMLSLLVANAVTGAASLLRRELLRYALPFPPAQFAHYHDHWIALVALARGEIAFVDRPLYDYVQHGTATLGHAAANQMPSLRERALAWRGDRRERVRMWRMHYFVDICRLTQVATILQLRCGEQMSPEKRSALRRFVETDRSLLRLGELAARGARELLGRRETLGAEWMLAHGFLWRRLLSATARDQPQRHLRLDAVPPPDLAPRAGRRETVGGSVRQVADKIAPLELAVSADAPARVNLLIPTIDLDHFFGGYIAKFNLARRLARRGVRVRIVTVDPTGRLPRGWESTVETYSGLAGTFDEVEVAFGRELESLEISAFDRFIATTWWTAHIAAAALESVQADRFLYLIQEYEPFTFPMGTYAALADDSYRMPHFALFSSELLRGYFRAHRIGVYASGVAAGDAASASFQNAISDVHPPRLAELSARGVRRLLFYARPEPHAARNMFELGMLALMRAIEEGTFDAGWQLDGIGSVEPGRRYPLGEGVELNVLARADQGTYASMLGEHDVGLALMYTPHPSLVPIEMAAAGMATVTSSFENKTAEEMSAISTNLITVEPSIAGIAEGLRAAVAASSSFEARVRGASVDWARDWDQAFGPELIDRIIDEVSVSPAASSAVRSR
jgi:glycosyltransferase involved in cell wall biosynthesis